MAVIIGYRYTRANEMNKIKNKEKNKNATVVVHVIDRVILPDLSK